LVSDAECNENITCFTLVGVLKMLAGVECEHLPELKKLALSCDASILHDVPDDIGRIAKKLMKNWWTNHGLSNLMQKILEENRVSFATKCFDERRCVVVYRLVFAQPEADEYPKGDGVGRDTEADVSTAKTVATAGTAGRDAQAEASVADMAAIHHEAEIPHQPEV
jgi:hypothetical protein